MTVDWDPADTALADRLVGAAELVEVGPPPQEAVLRGGRRRRARRRAAACGVALLVVAVTATAQAGGLGVWPGGGGDERGVTPLPLVAPPPPTEEPTATEPARTVLGRGQVAGQEFSVRVETWGAATTEKEGWDQLGAMLNSGPGDLPFDDGDFDWESFHYPPREGDVLPFELGHEWYMVYVETDGGLTQTAGFGMLEEPPRGDIAGGGVTEDDFLMDGTNLGEDEDQGGGHVSELQVVAVPPGVSRVEYRWENGTMSRPELIAAPGSEWRWFSVAGPLGVSPDSLHVYDARGGHLEIEPPY